MPDLTDLSQVASENDRVMPAWLNAVRNKLTSLEQQLAAANQTITQLRAETAQAFRVRVQAGLSLSYAGGTVKLLTGEIAVVQPGALTAPDNATNYIYIDGTGAIALATNRPDTGLEIAKVTASSGAVTELINYPQFAIKSSPVDLDDYATVDYADSKEWQLSAKGRKTAVFAIPATDTYYTIPFESLEGSGLNTGGVFTPPDNGIYLFNPRIRVDSLSPSSPLAVKLSLFINGVEYLLHQGDSAYGDLSASPMSEGFTLTTSDQVTMKVYLTRGVSARVREGSTFSCWRI